ncbi:alpha/beta hydrolase [Amaricoccus tamworthensis]|uniref:alpha/beta hydrolase n=1 Tax=Amaricoccus tamworthensis TaxID=57002 RepID=UPI003C79920A
MPSDVHPQIQAIIDMMAERNIPMVQDLTTDAARQQSEAMAAARRENYPPPEVMEVENTSTGAGYGHVPVRIYRTSNAVNAPVIVFYHGGGHVLGSLDSYDTTARHMAISCGCTLVSVDYRMAPEFPYPAAVDDCFDATRWVADNAETLRVDPDRIAIAGDSAGGNLAAVVALLARDAGAPKIGAQILVYPVIDYRGGTPSYDRYGKGYGVLETESVVWFMERYLPDAARRDEWRACPANAPSLADLPPAFVLTAECDVLHDEGVTYAGLLTKAGVEMEYEEFPGMVHGFFGWLGLVDDAERAHASVARFLTRIWS